MKTNQIKNKAGRSLALLLAVALSATSALAEKPDWAGKGKHGQSRAEDRQQRDDNDAQGQRGREGRYFRDEQRTVIRNYYSEQYRAGRCPPGLAKKHNGCMPPGQARKWAIGHPLPRDVVYYGLPPAVVVQLGVPPAGQRYVRVASDILLIAVGTGMVLDGIRDLDR